MTIKNMSWHDLTKDEYLFTQSSWTRLGNKLIKQLDFAVSNAADFIEQFLLRQISGHHQIKQECCFKLPSQPVYDVYRLHLKHVEQVKLPEGTCCGFLVLWVKQ